MSVESRLRALEAQRANESLLRSRVHLRASAQEAVCRGDATMSQCELIYGEIVTEQRDAVAETAMAQVALARHGSPGISWMGAMGYPPDAVLPAAIQRLITTKRWCATLTAEDTMRDLRAHPFLSAVEAPQRRWDHAVKMLILGDLHGVGPRQHIWTIDGDQWVPSDAVLADGERHYFNSARSADVFLDLRYPVTHVQSGDIAAQPGGPISYCELDRAVQKFKWEGRNGPSTWSNQVRSSQPGDREVCKDLESGVHRPGCPEGAGH